jgi:pimeloyl-ACP methyl ester carboxylesterase
MVGAILTVLVLLAGGCASSSTISQPPVLDPITGDAYPTPALRAISREQREVRFASQGVMLAGELDLPRAEEPAPLVFIIHHSGPVTRDAYGYMAELLVEAGFAVFRFDKRGVGASGGEVGCCEAEDALAAYQAAIGQPGIDPARVLIVAQSIGTIHLADRYAEYAAIHRPLGVVLLSSLLGPERITAIAAPVHVIVSDSEATLEAISVEAVAAHRHTWAYGATYFIAGHSEHTLFDIADGPIDWIDPDWVNRYHRGAMRSMIDWLRQAAWEKGR